MTEEEIEFTDAYEDDVWSTSKLKTIEACGKQFEYKYLIKGTIPVQTPYLAFGKAVHRVIELVHETKEWAEPTVLELWNDTWYENAEGVDFTGYFKPNFDDSGAKMLRKYIKKNKNAKVLELETPFPNDKEVYKIGQYVVRGIIDQVRRMDDGRLLVVDFKTSKYPPDPLILRADPQFTIYYSVAKAKYQEEPLLALYHLESSKMFFTERNENDVTLVEAQIKQGQAKIHQRMFERNVGVNCRYCPFIQDCLGPIGEMNVATNTRSS
jgi:RecB family exonuclease